MGRWKGIVKAIFVSAAVICACLPVCGAAAEEPELLEFALPYLEQNPATVGWLKVGDIVDTPVVRGDGTFYLNHDFFGQKSTGGMVFLDEECSILPRNDHMVLYGHNMRNGTVFGSLDRYRELAYLKAYPIISFDTIYEEGRYVVIAAYDMSAETEDPHFMQMLHFDFEDNEDFWNFFNYEVQRRNIYDIPVDVQYGDKLISLITCSYTLYDGRFILMCRELRPDEDPEEMAAAMQATVLK